MVYRWRSISLATNSRQRKRRSAAPSSKNRGGCGRWLLYGVVGLVALMGCGLLANIVSPRKAQDGTPSRSEAIGLVPETATPETTPTMSPTEPPPTEALPAEPPPTEVAPTVSSPTVSPTETPIPQPTATATQAPTLPPPTATSTAVPTIAPPSGPVANSQANVREGPGTEYAVMAVAQPGQVMTVTGRDSRGEWLQLGSGYWIAASLVDNAPADLPVTAVLAQLPGGNPTPVPDEETVPAPTPSWQREDHGIVFTSECPCDQGDTLNCGNFGIDMDAQACYMRCIDLAGRDVHRLDKDKDGSACEWDW